ncbi:MAG: GGDEF domain-containing protein, partial [Spirochaetales bacterium]|nr:GGDEF domain-containing protein [Spirochaetales bacterium]
DRFFIDGIDRDQKKKLFAENIVNMSHLMGIKVVAEGIETDQELNFCREIGCDYLQGYRIAKPEQDLARLRTSYSLDNGKELYGRRRGDAQSHLIEEHLTPIPAIRISEDGVATLKRFQKNPELSLLPVVNSSNEPIGVIREMDLKQYVYSPYGISLFKNHSHSRGLEPFISKIPMAEISSSLEKILDISASFGNNEGILITTNGKYLGLLDPSNLIKLIYEQKLAHAREQNPLTGLPGNFTIHSKLADVLASGNRKGCRVIFFDFNHFKPFNDTYGFRMGDRLIILFAELLKKIFSFENDFIAHVGGDDFIVIQENPDKDPHCLSVREAQQEFANGALSYYDPRHREEGCMRARNRKGRWECFKLITVSAAVLDIEHPGETSLDELNRLIFDLKKESKKKVDHFARMSLDYSEALLPDGQYS